MTIAEQLRSEGLLQGKRETLKKLLEIKFGELLTDEVERIEAASSEQLETWLTRFATAQKREEVWG